MEQSTIVAKRIKEARDNRGLSQQELASLMGLKSHSSIVAIENGTRDIKTWELLKIAEILKVSPESLYSEKTILDSTKPEILWRQPPKNSHVILQEENNITQHIEDYKLLENIINTCSNSTSKTLPIEIQSPASIDINWANAFAEKISREFHLGDYPGAILANRLEEDYGVLIITRPLEEGSAACYRNGNNSIIVINEKEAPWRQIFSIAHELFHLITWTPSYLEAINKNLTLFNKNEKTADAFAAALLMPQQMIDLDLQGNKLTYSLLVTLARKYNVSTTALLYRLNYLRIIPSKAVKEMLDDKDFIKIDRSTFKKAVQSTGLFGNRFARLAYLAYEKGLLSQARLAQMLCVKLHDVVKCLSEKGFHPTHDKEIKANNT